MAENNFSGKPALTKSRMPDYVRAAANNLGQKREKKEHESSNEPMAVASLLQNLTQTLSPQAETPKHSEPTPVPKFSLDNAIKIMENPAEASPEVMKLAIETMKALSVRQQQQSEVAPQPETLQPKERKISVPVFVHIPPPEPKISVLPWVTDGCRLVPDAILRSVLFGVQKKGARQLHWPSKEMASFDNIKIFYTGEQLDQGDLDVWETVLHIHAERRKKIGDEVCITGYEILKLMGLTDTGKNRKILVERLTRLRRCSVEISDPHFHYAQALVNHHPRHF